MFNISIPEGWSSAKLSDLGEVNRGRSRHRPRDATHLYGGKYPFIQTGGIKASNGRITTFSQTYSEEGLAQSRLWPKGTMCITIAATIAETSILTFPACFPDSVIGFIPDKTKCNVFFIEYVFRLLRKRIQAQATGSVQDNINLQTLEKIQFAIPDLHIQNRIADILTKYDDKIELNIQTNQTLEAMSQALFKSWFVDFDPVKAKIRGKKPVGMDAGELPISSLPKEVAALFPDKLVESDLGLIPEGWEVKPLSALIKLVGGGTPKRSEEAYWNGDIPWFSVKDVPNSSSDVFVSDTNEKITALGLSKSSTKLLPAGTTIITARGTVGKIALVATPMCMNQSCYGIQGANGLGPYFNYFNLNKAVSTLQQNTHGAVFDTITTKTFETYVTAFSGNKLANKFDCIVSPLLKRIELNVRENASLQQLRDTLLPKLLSDELTLNNEGVTS